MGNTFYLKLALTNLKKNRNAYIPYILAGIGMVFTYVLFLLISRGKGITNIAGADTLQVMFQMGSVIISIFSVIFIFYANSFLMKRRKKEIALYGILGLERRHVAIVMFFESIIAGLASILGGIVLGVVFGKLFFMMLMKLTNIAEGSKFIIDIGAFVEAAVFFLIVYCVTLLWNLFQIRMSKPVELLKGEEVGQKEKRSTLLLAIIGIGMLGAGYYIALSVVNPLLALSKFFVAVLLVIIGTYYSFRAGSIVVLKLLKKNKKYYYQTDHFITVSGMLHRMKQNATGLANICILSTMVLVTLSTTIALYVGEAKIVKDRNPMDYYLDFTPSKADPSKLEKMIQELADKNDVTVNDYTGIQMKSELVTSTKEGYQALSRDQLYSNNFGYYSMILLPLAEYNKCTNQDITLSDGEILLSADDRKRNETVMIGNYEYQIKGECKRGDLKFGKDFSSLGDCIVVVPDEEELIKLVNDLGKESDKTSDKTVDYVIRFNVDGELSDRIACANEIKRATYEIDAKRDFMNIDLDRIDSYRIFGGLAFLGFFLGIVFLLAMVLIIYFKQISEGFEDRKRYEILNKVGLDQKDVKRTINKQIIQVFFLPLLGAVIHVAFAFKMITKLLLIFNLTDTGLIVMCTVGAILVFTLIYVFVFKMTAKAYYRIINR